MGSNQFVEMGQKLTKTVEMTGLWLPACNAIGERSQLIAHTAQLRVLDVPAERSGVGLLWLEARELDDLGPLCSFFGDEPTKVLG